VVTHAVPARNQEVTVLFNFISERTVYIDMRKQTGEKEIQWLEPIGWVINTQRINQ
jgi:hypothetical protein